MVDVVYGPTREDYADWRAGYGSPAVVAPASLNPRNYTDVTGNGVYDIEDEVFLPIFNNAYWAARDGLLKDLFPNEENLAAKLQFYKFAATPLVDKNGNQVNTQWFLNTAGVIPQAFESVNGKSYRKVYLDNLTNQISGQRSNLDTSKYYQGGAIGAYGGIDAFSKHLAADLLNRGVKSIDQIVPKKVFDENGNVVRTIPVVVGEDSLNQYKQYYGNNYLTKLQERVNDPKDTGYGVYSPLSSANSQHQYADTGDAASDGYIWSGTYAGDGNTAYKMQFTSQGLPVFYSSALSSSDFDLKDLAPFVAIASLAIPGMGAAIGNFVAGAAGVTVPASVAAGIGSFVLTSALTQDIKKGLVSAIGAGVGSVVANELASAASGIFESSAGQNFLANIGSAGARAAVMGEDVEKAIGNAAVGGLFNLASAQVPGFDEIKDPKIKSAVADSINAALNTQGDLSAKLSNAALQGAITYGANKIEVDGKKFPELTPGQKDLIVTTLSSQLTGKPLNQELINSAISNTNRELTTAIRQPPPLAPVGADEFTGGTPAAQPEDFGQVTGGLPAAPAGVVQPDYSEFLGPRIQGGIVSPLGDVGPPIIRDNLSFPTDPEAMGYQGFPRPVFDFFSTVPQGQFAPPTIESVPTETSPVITRQEPVASNEEILYPGSGVGTSIGELAGSGVVSDVSAPTLGDRYERFRTALQPGATQIWLPAELEGLQNIVDRMRAAGISDDVIEETLVAEQARNADFRTTLLANRTTVGDGTSERPGGEVAAGIAIGESATPPEEGGRPFMGAGSGQTGGLPVFSLIAIDQGVSTYDMNNGFTLFAFSDGRQRVMDNETKVIVDLTPEEATELIPKIIEADRNAEAQVKSADKPASEARPVDTQPVDSKPAEPIDVKPVEVKPVEAKPAESVEVKPVDVKPVDIKPAEVKPTEVQPVEVKPVEVQPSDKPTEVSPDAQQVAADLARKVLADSDTKVTQEPAQLDASKLTATSPSTSTTSTSTGSTATGSTATGSTATESAESVSTGATLTGGTSTGGTSATDLTGGTSTGGTSTTATDTTAADTTATRPAAALQNANAIEASKIASGASAFDARYDLNNDGKVDQSDIDALEGGAALNPVISTSQSTTGGNTLVSGGGNDTLIAGGGNDTLKAGGGNDTLVAGGDTLVSGGGNDTLVSGRGNDTLVAGGGNDTLVAGTGNDTLASGGGNDTLVSGGGNDTLVAGGTNMGLSDADITRIANSVVIPAGLSETDVRRIVTDVIATRPGLTSTDVSNIVNEAVKKLPAAPTSTDISNIVSTATKDFATKSDVTTAISNIQFPQGISREDVTAAITDYMTKNPGLSLTDVTRVVTDAITKLPPLPTVPSSQDIKDIVATATSDLVSSTQLANAISGIKFPASLSKTDVEGIVTQVMRDNPGISTADVQNIVNTAISNLPKYATPADVSTAISTQIGSPSVKDDPNTPQDESRPATGVYQLFEQQEADRLKKEQEDAKKAEDERKAAQLRIDLGKRQDLLQTGAGIAAAGLGAVADSGIQQPTSPLQALQTGEGSKVEFESPLAAFFALQEPKEEPKQEAPLAMNYFTYGQPSEVSDILGLQEEDQMAASGGLMTPLMKGGGLSVVHYAGKPRIDFRKGSYVEGPGDGQSDDIPAMLADGEYVFDAETVAALGNGSNRAGAKLLDKMREEIRSHKRSGSLKKIPPPSKSPLEYLSMARRRS